MSTDVRLPRNVVPVFPDACCACGREQPGDHVVWKGRRIRFAELLMPWLWFVGKRVRVEVPVCAACRPAVLANRRWTIVVAWAGVALAMYFVLPWVKSWGLGRTTTKLATIGMTIVVLAPLLFWWVMHPPKFDLTVFRDHIDYEFASQDYALRFFESNPDAISVD